MRNTLFLIIAVPLLLAALSCDEHIKNEQARPVLIRAEQTSQNTYLIICAGFPKAGVAHEVQRIGTAKEAALLNAQMIARQRFMESFDVVTHGSIQKYLVKDTHVEIYYLLKRTNIAQYLR